MVMATASLYHPYDTGDLTLEVRVSVNVTNMLNLKNTCVMNTPENLFVAAVLVLIQFGLESL